MEKMQQQQQQVVDQRYVEALEMERMKMLMFERELPLSIELVSRAIESCRLQLTSMHRSSESTSEETTSDVRVLEFIPVKKSTDECSSGSGDDEAQPHEMLLSCDKDDESGQKSDWLRSVQLWNQTPDLPAAQSEELPGKELVDVSKEQLCDKSSSNMEKSEEKIGRPGKAESSSMETKESQKIGEDKKEDKESSSSCRKQRRCWSQDLHRRFLHSLQQLGGAHVATPKQIRELMKVDGLTNDEVKSHLQKYRLHTRRPTPPPNLNNDSHAQNPPQFMIVGGIWATPSSNYNTMTMTQAIAVNNEANGASGAPRSGIYTPMASPPIQPLPCHGQGQLNQKPQIKSKNSETHGDALARCISPSMSSSTRTTTSQVY